MFQEIKMQLHQDFRETSLIQVRHSMQPRPHQRTLGIYRFHIGLEVEKQSQRFIDKFFCFRFYITESIDSCLIFFHFG